MKYIIAAVLMSLATFAMAHSPHISTYNLRQVGGVWVIEGSYAQSSLDAALIEQVGEEALKGYDEQSYKVEVLDLLRKNIYLKINGVSVSLGEAGIKLGSHQTDVKFVIEGSLKGIKYLEAQIKPLPGIEGHQNVLRFLFNGKKEKLILGEKNNYSSSIGSVQTPEANPADYRIPIIIILLVAGAGIFILYKVINRQRSNPA